MKYRSPAVHRTIVAVDIEGFGNRRRNNRNQVTIRDGLYRAMQEAFGQAEIPWIDHDREDRGDGIFILVGSEVPKSLFVESLPSALVAALHRYNNERSEAEQIRLRMALHAGEVNYDKYGVTAASINLTFRLLESGALKEAFTGSAGVLAIITSPWFFEEVVQHCGHDIAATYRSVRVVAKETITTGWICIPGQAMQLHAEESSNFPSVITRTAQPIEDQYSNDVQKELSLVCRSALKEPIIPAADMPAGLAIPTLSGGYVDHRFRVTEITPSSEPGNESWWTEISVDDDVCQFLIARLTSPEASRAPVILLGQPGSGKSVLARILAARVSAIGHLAIPVVLRQVPAEADLQDQIEFAIRSATGRTIPWPQFIESSERVLPVLIFDGFDELLQTTGTVHDDFLLRVQAFQEREARLGRSLAVIVTSRIAVTNRARIPFGATVVRLEPFCREQIASWLMIWEQHNSAPLARRGLESLSVGTALRYQELAEQPLLLLMLALYDADANALQRRSAALDRTELYERLLQDFARREVRKNAPAISEENLEHAVEAELIRLSVVAFAMFNRRSQWVPEAELSTDFSVLLIDREPYIPETSRSPDSLTIAQFTVGRFFFIYESQATYDNHSLRTYEFLHPTFGEFLVARLVAKLLTEIPEFGHSSDHLSRDRTDRDALLHALLSFAALSSRLSVVSFVGDLLNGLNIQQRAAIADYLLMMHSRALYPYGGSSYDSYQPLALTVTTRHAAWSANLVLLAVYVAGKVTGRQLFPQEPEVGQAWRNEAMLWRSQLAGYGWEGLYETIALDRIWIDQRREIILSRDDGTFVPADPDMNWSFSIRPTREVLSGVLAEHGHNSFEMQRRINFTSILGENIMAHALSPLVSTIPTIANAYVALDGEHVVSASHALLSAIYAPYQENFSGDSVYLRLARTAYLLTKDPSLERDHSYLKTALRVLISAVERELATPASLEPLAGLVRDTITEDCNLTELLSRLDEIQSHHR